MCPETHTDGAGAPSAPETPPAPTVDPHAVVREHWAAPCDCDTPCDPECVACGEPWRGGATDGGCEARLLARLLLKALEHINEYSFHAVECPAHEDMLEDCECDYGALMDVYYAGKMVK